MIIGDEINLDGLMDETLDWFEQIQTKCRPRAGGSWWNHLENRPDIGGIFVIANLQNNEWRLENAGVYDYGKPKYIISPKKYLFNFKGVDWTENTLKTEIVKQYKEFKLKTKIIAIKEDFV